MAIRAKRQKSEEQLMQNLICSLNKYPEKIGFRMPGVVISNRNILNQKQDVVNEKLEIRCDFSCPFCAKVIPVTYKAYWMTSNVTKHLKKHIDEQVKATGEGSAAVVTFNEANDAENI